jgi:hypothetical protein
LKKEGLRSNELKRKKIKLYLFNLKKTNCCKTPLMREKARWRKWNSDINNACH